MLAATFAGPRDVCEKVRDRSTAIRVERFCSCKRVQLVEACNLEESKETKPVPKNVEALVVNSHFVEPGLIGLGLAFLLLECCAAFCSKY